MNLFMGHQIVVIRKELNRVLIQLYNYKSSKKRKNIVQSGLKYLQREKERKREK